MCMCVCDVTAGVFQVCFRRTHDDDDDDDDEGHRDPENEHYS